MLKQETENAATAFVANAPYTGARTRVDKNDGMYLHGVRIARRATYEGKQCYAFNMCGYPTNLTIDRLNGITEIAFGMQMFRRKNKAIYFGHGLLREVEPDETIYIPIDFKPGDHHVRARLSDSVQATAG